MRSPLISAVAALALTSPLPAQSAVECQPAGPHGYLSITAWVDHADGPGALAPTAPDPDQRIFCDSNPLAPGQPFPPPSRDARNARASATGEDCPPSPWVAAGWLVLDPDPGDRAPRPVPEPAAATFLIGMGAAALIRRRRLA
jgi:MYXO-CTERM domain-containing protein